MCLTTASQTHCEAVWRTALSIAESNGFFFSCCCAEAANSRVDVASTIIDARCEQRRRCTLPAGVRAVVEGLQFGAPVLRALLTLDQAADLGADVVIKGGLFLSEVDA